MISKTTTEECVSDVQDDETTHHERSKDGVEENEEQNTKDGED